MTTKTRLAKIEKGLSPPEIVLAWLDEVLRRFDAFGEWLEWAAQAPGESPYLKLPKAAMEAAAAGRKGRREDTQRAQEDAALNTVFLVSLSVQCSVELQDTLSECELMAAFCARGLQVLLLRELLGEEAALAGPAGRGGDWNEAGDHPAGLGERDIVAVRSRIADLLKCAYLRRAVIRAIQHNYFAGHEVLFRDTAGRLASVIFIAETLANEYNDFIRGRQRPSEGLAAPAAQGDVAAEAPDAAMIDLAKARASARSQVRVEVAFTVTMAKAEALSQMDRRQEAADLALRAVRNGTSKGPRQLARADTIHCPSE